MKSRVAVSVLSLLVAMFALAAPSAESKRPPEDLQSAVDAQAAEREAIQTKAGEGAAALRKWYESALDALKKDAGSKGNLDGVIAAEAERGRMDRELTGDEMGKLPPTSLAVRKQFDQARANQAAQLQAALTASLRNYVATLEGLEKRLTQKEDIDGALVIRKARTAIAAQLAAGDSRALEDAGTKIAGGTARPPAATAPVTPPARAEAPKVEVTAQLMCTAYVKSALSNLVAFMTPVGPLRARGGRGVLLKNDPATGRLGTTWTFTLSRKAPDAGVQIVHPFGDGHIIVHLRPEGLFLVAPPEVAKTPWVGGDSTMIKLTEAGAKIFPFSKRSYQVVSQLSATGKYTISLNGEVAGTASLAPGPPLSLSREFKADNGAELPLKWHPGYAALIAGAAEQGGGNMCANVTFQASAPEPAP